MPARRARDDADRRDLHATTRGSPGTPHVYDPDLEPLEGGDVLLLAPGVLAVGTGERTTPAGVERLARRVFARRARAHRARRADRAGAGDHAPRHGLHDGRRRRGRDVPATRRPPGRVALTPSRRTTSATLRVAAPEPFLVAAAKAMGIDTLRIIDTGLDPVTAEREQWDDGNNTLAHRAAACGRLRAQHRDQRPAGARPASR